MSLLPAVHAQSVTFRIGVIGPFTGPSADLGVPMLNGMELAVDEINAVGGYMGSPLELVIKDDQGNPAEGRKQSEALAVEKVAAVLGFCNTAVAAHSVDVYQSAKLPLIIPCATGTALTSKFAAPQSYVFRRSASDAIQVPFVVEEIVKRGWTRVAVFADATGYGEAGLKEVEVALKSKGLKPVHVARFALGAKDLTPELRAARDAGANVVFGYTEDNAVIAKGRKELGWKVPQVGAWPLSFPSFIDGAGDAAEGVLAAQTFIAEASNERRAAFLSAYARKYKTRAIRFPMAAAQAYDATYILLYALLGIRDGNATGPTIKRALENLNRTYYGVVATYEKPFNLNDKDALSQNMLVMGMVKNGGVTFANPEDAKRQTTGQRKQ